MVETEVVKESYSGEFTTKTPLFFFLLKKSLTGCFQEKITP